MTDEPQCDFCTSTDVKWAFPARDFRQQVAVRKAEVPGLKFDAVIHAGSLGAWAACPACHALILRGDRDRLCRRSAKRMVRKHPILSMKIATDLVRTAHDNFWSHREGAPVPTNPGDPDPFQEDADA